MRTADIDFIGQNGPPVVAYDVVVADPQSITIQILTGATSATLGAAGAATAWNSSLTIAGPLTGPVLQIATSGNIVNDPIYAVLVGFGDGHDNYGPGAYHDFTNAPSGRYEAVVHVITEAGAKIGRAIEFDWDADALTFANFASGSGNPVSYSVSAACVWVTFTCDGSVSRVWNEAGAYTTQGVLWPCKPDLPQSQWYESGGSGGGKAITSVPLAEFCAIVGTQPTVLTPILDLSNGETHFYDNLGNEVLPVDFTLAANPSECGCGANYDFEQVCLSADGGATTRTGWARFDDKLGTQELFEADGATAVADGAVVVPCASRVTVTGDGSQIAGPDRATLPAFTGAPSSFNTSAIPGALQSITVTAFASTAGMPGLTTNQVVVSAPGGNKINLASGESRTWSIEREQDYELRRDFDISATGNAYATITWTYV